MSKSDAQRRSYLADQMTMGADEEWRSIPELDDYEASSFGRVRRVRGKGAIRAGRVLSQHLHLGYSMVQLMVDGAHKCKRVHRLVLAAFTGESPSADIQCNHINGIKTDNRPNNLEWCTRVENAQHAVRLGLIKVPRFVRDNHPRTKVKSELLAEVRRRVAGGERRYKIAAEIGMTPSGLGRALSGKG